MKLLLLLFIILVFALFGIIQGLRTRQLNGENTSRKWHKIQAVLHGLIALAVSIHFGIISGVIAFLFTLITIWIVFDLAHNLTTTNTSWYYAEDAGINGTLKKKIGERGIVIVKGIAFLILLFFYFFVL